MTTTQITTLTIQGICFLICLGALIYQLHNYRKMKKQLKQREEEAKNQPVIYDYYFKPFPTKEHIIKTACGLGYTQREIAKIVGLSQSTVFRIMRKHGWKKAVFNTKTTMRKCAVTGELEFVGEDGLTLAERREHEKIKKTWEGVGR